MKLGPYELGPNDTKQGIYTGDARELAEAIPDESVDLIFTDPVYDRIENYEWLAETAARVLKPDSACLVWYGIGYAPETHAALSKHLSYRWRLVNRTVWSNEFHGRLIVGTTECLWYEKGRSVPQQGVFDLQMITMKDKGAFNKNGSNWGKNIAPTRRYIETFSRANTIIFDPFAGSGTTGVVCKQLSRHWLAFEIDPDTAELARERVRQTQPPLFVLEHEQMEFDLGDDT